MSELDKNFQYLEHVVKPDIFSRRSRSLLANSLEEIFPDEEKPYTEISISDWHRERTTLVNILDTLSDPLKNLIGNAVRPHLKENVQRIADRFPGQTLSDNFAQTFIQSSLNERLEKIGKESVRRLRLYRPQEPREVDPAKSALYKKLGDDKSVAMLTPALEYTIPVAITKLGNHDMRAKPIRAVVIYARQYIIRQTAQGKLDPQLRGTTNVVYEEKKAVRRIIADQELKEFQAHFREAWESVMPISVGRVDSN